MFKEPFLKHVTIRNYKSIGQCDVDLRPLTILVGRNGSGKSNFLDALRFVADGLESSLDHAIKSRGGIDEVRRRSTGHPRNFAIRLVLNLKEWQVATYGFEIGARPQGAFFVRHERLEIRDTTNQVLANFHLDNAELKQSSVDNMPPAVTDRLYLVNAAGVPAFREVYDALLAMGFYNLNPQAMKELQSPDAGELLHRDGSNVASVIGRMQTDEPTLKDRVQSYLATIVPGVSDIARVTLGPKETLEFRQEVEGAKQPWRFYATSMSDGTLRALGTLVAVKQLAGRKLHVRLVGIEEPETALHPAASGALMDALREAAVHTQVLVTTHSPDLLDQVDPRSEMLLAVNSRRGTTEIGRIDQASVDSIRDHLYTAGDLLRMDQLEPEFQEIERQRKLVFATDGSGDDS